MGETDSFTINNTVSKNQFHIDCVAYEYLDGFEINKLLG